MQVALAKTAENLIVVISDANDEGGEGRDRASIALAADQVCVCVRARARARAREQVCARVCV